MLKKKIQHDFIRMKTKACVTLFSIFIKPFIIVYCKLHWLLLCELKVVKNHLQSPAPSDIATSCKALRDKYPIFYFIFRMVNSFFWVMHWFVQYIHCLLYCRIEKNWLTSICTFIYSYNQKWITRYSAFNVYCGNLKYKGYKRGALPEHNRLHRFV